MRRFKIKHIALMVLLTIAVCSICVGTYIYLTSGKIDSFTSYVTQTPFEEGKEFAAVGKNSAQDTGLKEMTLAAENEQLQLYVHEKTTEIAVLNKATKQIVYSNPQTRAEDTIANGINKEMLASQLYVEYFNPSRNKATMINYTDSISRNQFKLESLKDGFRVTYTIGNLGSSTGTLPKFITEARLNEAVLAKLNEADEKVVKKQYVVSKNKEGFLELRENAVKATVTFIKLQELFAVAGYDAAQLEADNGAAEGGDTKSTKPIFVIPLEYRLVKDQLQVNIPTEKIEETNGKISRIDVLGFFGAAGVEDEGYMLVPNGSGSLIYLNNNKTKVEPYTQQIFGMDPVTMEFTQTQNLETARLPVFGLKNGDLAWFARITDAQAISMVNADISGKVNSFNSVWNGFIVRDSEQLSMFGTSGGESDLPVVEEKMYQGQLTIHYAFLSGEDANYSGMAKNYRQQLIQEGVLSKLETGTTPFFLDVLGSLEKKKTFVGVPYKATFAMTTYEEATAIASELEAQTAAPIQMRLLGWFNDGYYHDVAKSIDLISQMGNKKDLNNLQTVVSETGGTLYNDVAFQKVCYTSDEFMPVFEGARYLSGMTLTLTPYNRATMRIGTRFPESVYYTLSAAVLPKHVRLFLESMDKTTLTGVSLRDLGDVISSDKKKKAPITRELSKDIAQSQLAEIGAAIPDVMIAGGNEYALKDATALVDVPTYANTFYIVDAEVPFYEMVIHGYKDYTGKPFNLNSTYEARTETLKMLEYGFGPHFLWTYEDTSKLKGTSLDFMYSTQYKVWLEEAVSLYKEVSKTLDQVRNQNIIHHEIIHMNVRKTVYENGVTVIVNYSNEDVTVPEGNVPAVGYLVTGGNQ